MPVAAVPGNSRDRIRQLLRAAGCRPEREPGTTGAATFSPPPSELVPPRGGTGRARARGFKDAETR